MNKYCKTEEEETEKDARRTNDSIVKEVIVDVSHETETKTNKEEKGKRKNNHRNAKEIVIHD